MMKQLKSKQVGKQFFAVDLGATSGRTIIGSISTNGADDHNSKAFHCVRRTDPF